MAAEQRPAEFEVGFVGLSARSVGVVASAGKSGLAYSR